MTTTQTVRSTKPRKTTTAVLNPDEWKPITDWLRKHEIQRSAREMFIAPDAAAGLAQLLRKAARAEADQDITIRLNNDLMHALWEQMRFWTTHGDELKREFRRNMPNWMHFHCMADRIEGYLEETHLENDRRTGSGGQTPAGRTRIRNPRQ